MLFALICTDRPGSLDLRLATRPQHLAYIETYASRVVHAGALLDIQDRPQGSLFILDVADRAEAEGFAAGDPYGKVGLFESAVVRPYKPVYRDGEKLGLMAYWLVKSEPDAFGWEQQVAHKVEPWTGVRNHMAKNNLKAMRKGDRAFFYHSNIGKEIVGVVEVVREAYPDPTVAEDDPKGDWVCVDMKALRPMKRPVTLAQVKADPKLADLGLVKFSRLSVAPVSAEHWSYICKLGGWR